MESDKMLDFTQRKKKKLPVKLHDGFVVLLPMPSKAIFDKITNIEHIKKADEIYETVRIIINQNPKRKYSIEKINSMFDLEDAVEFIKEYVNFTTGVISDPN
jgi:predicted glycosyltransferase